MSNVKFKAEINGVDIKEGDIVDIKGTYTDAWGDLEEFNYTGRVIYLDREMIELDCSEKYNYKKVDVDIHTIHTVKIL